MSPDTLTLGPFVFTDFRVPDRMPFGGKQQLVIHKMPGGARSIDAMGPDDNDRAWAGTMWGDNAYSDMLTLDALRRQGAPLAFSWGAESRTAIIMEFKAEVEKWTCVHYDITVVLDDDGDGAGGSLSLDAMVSSDLIAAVGLL